MDIPNLTERLEADQEADLFDLFLEWTMDKGLELYPAQEEAILEIFDDNHVVLNTPTGSGKSLVALAMHFYSFARGERSYYTSPIKALVSEKFFALCESFGAQNVGMSTGDASINLGAPIMCCTQEILASIALREGVDAQVHHAIIDEFHYYADPERGTAWQLPLLMMPQTAFLLMSATLGDTTPLRRQLTEFTGRDVALVRSTSRPVPLTFEYSKDKVVHLIAGLMGQNRAPIYLVCFTQRECAELAQSLMSNDYCTKEEKAAIKEALKGTSFDTPYGSTVRRFLSHGVAIHHGGMLPKYRFLAEKLSQQGLLKIVVGTDTLGVGINMPLRTVVFTKLCKFDGTKVRILTVREFKQIAGRAGRKGFDDHGYVIAMAPEHVIENEATLAKAKAKGKTKKVRLKPPPDKGYAHWDDQTYEKLYTSDSEALVSRFNINHSTLLSLLQRPIGAEHGFDDLLDLIDRSHERDVRKEQLVDKANMLLESLEHAGILTQEDGVVALAEDLQQDFSVHHSLSLFLVEVVDSMNPEHDEFHLTACSFVEAILEDPGVVLRRQRDKLRDREYQRLKAEGVEYEELRERLDKVTWPQPDADVIRAAFDAFSSQNPWVQGFELRLKSVARDMFERYTSFNAYVKEYGLERSEGVLLRHLNQTYKALRQNIPDASKTPRIHEIIAYLRQVITRADSSLVKEWEALRNADLGIEVEIEGVSDEPIDKDLIAFKARIRAEIMELVAALADKDYVEASMLVPQVGEGWGPADFEDALAPFYEDYDRLLFNHDARNHKLVRFEHEGPGQWHVTQVLLDPDGDNMWYLEGYVDLSEIEDEEDRLFVLETIDS